MSWILINSSKELKYFHLRRQIGIVTARSGIDFTDPTVYVLYAQGGKSEPRRKQYRDGHWPSLPLFIPSRRLLAP